MGSDNGATRLSRAVLARRAGAERSCRIRLIPITNTPAPPRPPAPNRPQPSPVTCTARHATQGNAHRADYTLVHAGRQVRIGPIAFWIVVGTLVIMGVWSIATGTYFAFREDVLTRLIGRQAAMQFAYEDRIAELRAQVDRITSRQLLDQEQFEQKLQGLLRRQTMLEQRTSAISNDTLTDRLDQAGARRAAGGKRRAAHAQAVADQRYRYLRRAARPRGAPAIARTGVRRDPLCQQRQGRRPRRHSNARLARPRQGRTPADRGAHRHGRRNRHQGAPHSRRARRSRRQCRQGARRHRRPLRAAEGAALRRQRLRAPDLPHQCRARANRQIHPHARSTCRCASPSSAKSI